MHNVFLYIDHLVISQIRPGHVRNHTAGTIHAFQYDPCVNCGDLINSVYYREYLQSYQDSTSVLEQVSKIVSSSTDFRHISRCAQFSAKWAFVVTWIEAGDDYTPEGSGFTELITVSTGIDIRISLP